MELLKIQQSPGHFQERMPRDLLKYVCEQKAIADVSNCEQEPADVTFEIISAESFEMKAYFPVSRSGTTVVFMHLVKHRRFS